MNRSLLFTSLTLVGSVAVVAAAHPLQQSGERKACKLTNVSWCEIRHLDFKPGKADAAIKIIRESFLPAAESAGLPSAHLFEYATGGRWDIQMIFSMTDGPSALEWEIHPNDEKWMAALASRCGGEDQAEALLAEYRDMIASTEGQIAFERMGNGNPARPATP